MANQDEKAKRLERFDKYFSALAAQYFAIKIMRGEKSKKEEVIALVETANEICNVAEEYINKKQS